MIELQGPSTASDIWSLGCTIIELMTGKPPYADVIPMTAMFRIVQGNLIQTTHFIDDSPPLPENISQVKSQALAHDHRI